VLLTDGAPAFDVGGAVGNGTDIGLIHQRNGCWTNYPFDDASVKTRVSIGPFLSMESVFEAYRLALGDADSKSSEFLPCGQFP
jgi:hypothetical protein